MVVPLHEEVNKMEETVIVELLINDEEQQLLTDWLIKNKIKHNLYTFEIGSLGQRKKK